MNGETVEFNLSLISTFIVRLGWNSV